MIGGMIAVSINLLLMFKLERTPLTKIFYVYGALVALWNFLLFFHRNAASKELSHLFFRFSSSISVFLFSFVILLLAYIYKEKKIYLLVLLPSILLSSIILLKPPFKIVDSTHGWTYATDSSNFGTIIFSLIFILIIAAIVIGLYLLRKIDISGERKRIKLIIFAVGGIYLGGMGVTNLLLVGHPEVPPFGGILTTAEFLVITYAVSLPSLNIYLLEKEGYEGLESLYLDFFNDFQQNIPDERMGKAEIYLKESLEAMGLDHILTWNNEGKIYLDSRELRISDIGELVDTSLRGLKLLSPNADTVRSFSKVMNHTYKEKKDKNEEQAEEWSEYILREHGRFLNENDMLPHIDFIKSRPELLNEIRDQRVLLKPAEKPLDVYEEVEKLRRFGYDIKCITKYPMSKVRARIHCANEDVLEVLDYINGEAYLITPNSIHEKIRKRWSSKANTITIIDCLDIFKASIGKDSSYKLIRSLIESGEGVFLLIYNEEILKGDEMWVRGLRRG